MTARRARTEGETWWCSGRIVSSLEVDAVRSYVNCLLAGIECVDSPYREFLRRFLFEAARDDSANLASMISNGRTIRAAAGDEIVELKETTDVP